MITNPEHEQNRQARQLLQEARVEVGDDPRSYVEIAGSLGLLTVENTAIEVQPAVETAL